MGRFLLHRFLWGCPVLLLVATVTFVIMHLVPGGPFDKEKPLPPEIKANVEAKYHLDKPLYQQYLLYMEGIIRGDLGPSYKYLGRTVRDIIRETFPVSIQLGGLALGVSVLLGVPAGIMAALRPHSIVDRAGMLCTVVGISTPTFVLGTLLVLVFAHLAHLLPPALWEGTRYVIMPALTLGLGPAAYIARLTRSSVLDVIRAEYIRAARAKGVGEVSLVLKHVLKNSITPVVTILGPLTAVLVTGSFVVEYIFSIPGMGRFFVTAVTNRDYPLIMGVTLVYAATIVVANIAVDFLYAILDPRVRMRRGRE